MDDTLPQSVALQGSPPILHLYTFVPSVIVGKYQDIESALKLDRCQARGVEYNRRSTGGGTVIMGPEIIALGLGINVDSPFLKSRSMAGVFESIGGVLIKALEKLGIPACFRPKNDLEVGGKKIAGLSAASETGKSLLFHTSFLVDFDVELMTDIMNTPLVKLSDKGYNCFSQRVTTVRQELGKKIAVTSVMDAIQESFQSHFGIEFQEDQPDPWEKRNHSEVYQRKVHKSGVDLFPQASEVQDGGWQAQDQGRACWKMYLSLSGGAIENVVITGDFFSTSEDINRLENTLKWASAREESIREKAL